MSEGREYDDIPGTYVYDSRRCRQGYALNMFCMSLNKPENRNRLKNDEAGYLSGFALSIDQRQAVVDRDWLGLLKLGGNIYYTIKIAFCDGLSFQDVASKMSGVSKEDYVQMMLSGGRQPPASGPLGTVGPRGLKCRDGGRPRCGTCSLLYQVNDTENAAAMMVPFVGTDATVLSLQTASITTAFSKIGAASS